MKPANLLGRKNTSHAPGRECSEGKLIPGACQELPGAPAAAGAWQEKRRRQPGCGAGGAGDNCSRKVCGTWRGGRGAVQGPALPRARAGCAPGALPAAIRSRALPGPFLGGAATLSRDLLLGLLAQILLSQLKPHSGRSGMDHAGAWGVFGYRFSGRTLWSTPCLSFPTCEQQQRCSLTLTKHSRDPFTKPAHHPASNPPFPCQGELQRVLSSHRKLLQPGRCGLSSAQLGSAQLSSPGVPSPPHAALSWFFSPQPRDRYLKRS